MTSSGATCRSSGSAVRIRSGVSPVMACTSHARALQMGVYAPRSCMLGVRVLRQRWLACSEDGDIVIRKGQRSDVDSYSAFGDALGGRWEDTGLSGVLRGHGIESVVVAGLPADFCVAATAKDAARHGESPHPQAPTTPLLPLTEPRRSRPTPFTGVTSAGFRTVLVEDASRGLTRDGVARERQAWTELGVAVARTDDVVSMLRDERRSHVPSAPPQVRQGTGRRGHHTVLCAMLPHSARLTRTTLPLASSWNALHPRRGAKPHAGLTTGTPLVVWRHTTSPSAGGAAAHPPRSRAPSAPTAALASRRPGSVVCPRQRCTRLRASRPGRPDDRAHVAEARPPTERRAAVEAPQGYRPNETRVRRRPTGVVERAWTRGTEVHPPL